MKIDSQNSFIKKKATITSWILGKAEKYVSIP